MREITFNVSADPETGLLVAAWDDPTGGGITTQADSLQTLPDEIRDAIRCHFDAGELPARVNLHFQNDPILSVTESA
jgi:hypothetical protein